MPAIPKLSTPSLFKTCVKVHVASKACGMLWHLFKGLTCIQDMEEEILAKPTAPFRLICSSQVLLLGTVDVGRLCALQGT